jgi:membrane protease YdiL (CAAX protease family)
VAAWNTLAGRHLLVRDRRVPSVPRLRGLLGRGLRADHPSFGPWVPALISGLLAGILEEFGWSGFAFPRLQALYGFVPVGVGMGFIVAFWHLPLFFTPGQPQHEFAFMPFLLTLSRSGSSSDGCTTARAGASCC